MTGVIATAVRAMLAAGMPHEDIISAVADMEAAQAAALTAAGPTRSKRQDRNARYYERHKAELKAKRDAEQASETVLIKTPKTVSDADQTLSDGSDPALPAPSPDGRPSPPAPPHPTLNPSPTPDSQSGAGAPSDEGEGQDAGLDLDDEPANPDPTAGKRTKTEKPRMNDWPEDFREQFWSAYPRKVAKKPAMKELERIFLSDKVPFFEIIDGVKLLVRLGIEPEFIKHPDSWLRNERWNDEQTQRLNSRNHSTNPQNRMTLAAESKTFWHNQSAGAHERLREKANGQRNDHDAPAGPALEHEPRRQPGASAEPGSRQRSDAGRPGAAGGSGDGRRPAFASLPSRIPGW